MNQESLNELWLTVQAWIAEYSFKVLAAIIIIVVGFWLAQKISHYVEKGLSKAKVDQALARFARSLSYYAILVLVFIAALDQLGVQTASMIALLGAAGLAIGLALEGALSNFAAGVLLLFFRPFRIGDLVEIADQFGRVEEIKVFNTILITPENKTVILPNSQVTDSPIINYSKRGLIRLDMVFGIGYDDDLLKAKRILREIVTADDRVVRDPAPVVAVKELADSSVNFAVRPYIDPNDYWTVYFDLTEKVKLRFDEEGISIPYPQRDVHLFPQK